MLFLLSPSKSLDFESPVPPWAAATPPPFGATRGPAAQLISRLRSLSPAELSSLMHISPALAELNAGRYKVWRAGDTHGRGRPAIFAFDGDVYGGFDARSLGRAEIEWANAHVCILSGLYGVLRPLDCLQPYRLEMGTRLANGAGPDLYAFWRKQLVQHLNARLAADASPVVVNLASEEYFRAVDQTALKARVVECVFEEWKNDRYKIISFFAKRARGLMARWAALQRAGTPAALQNFDLEGYRFAAGASTMDRIVFRRKSE